MKKAGKKPLRVWFRNRIEWPAVGLIVRLLAWMVGFLPYSCLWAIARLGGTIVWCVPSCRRLIRANVKVAFPDRDASAIGRASLSHLFASFLEMFWVRDRPERLAAAVDISDALPLMQSALAAEGCVLLSPHLGSWELGHQALALAGIPASCVALRQRNVEVDAVFHAARSVYGGEVIYSDGAVRSILGALKSKRLVEMLVDQNTSPGKGGVLVPFFGLPALMSRAPALFLRKSGVRLVIGFCHRLGNGRFRGEFVHLPSEDVCYKTDEALLEAINFEMAALIARAPEQYLWLYRRWPYIPADSSAEVKQRYPYYAREFQF